LPTAAPPAATAPAPAPAPQAAPAPRRDAMVAPKPAEKSPPRPPQQAARADQRSAAGSLSGALRSVQQQHPDEKVYGSPTGSASGTSDEQEGDPYQAEVQQIIQDRYVLPTTISEQERLYLRAEVVVHIAATGAIARYEFVKRSGNAVFDGALEGALRSARLPPPPPDMQRRYLAEGLALAFRADQK
jgi:outer membrane biosynthesis protein TonB